MVHASLTKASLGEVIHAIDSDAILMYEPAPFPVARREETDK